MFVSACTNAHQAEQLKTALAKAEIELSDIQPTPQKDGTSYVFEYNTNTLTASDVFRSSDKNVQASVDGKIDCSKLGEQTISYTLSNNAGKRTGSITCVVKDTQGPTCQVKKPTVKITQGDTFDPTSNIEVKDPVDGALALVEQQPTPIKTDSTKTAYKTGWYTVTITGSDKHGNNLVGSTSYTVVVEEAPKPVEESKPAENTNEATGTTEAGTSSVS
ncbi:hypothetical protein [Atopobium minutum]|uniref:hypothetical protein n=1 Tax=Atopobium minutum TaxID=1381 RepID=UPI00280A965F|nr:hypothetical protein [Atopobium minutum]